MRWIDPTDNALVPGNHDYEASSSGVKMSRKARRKYNAQLRAAGLLPVNHKQQGIPTEDVIEANIPTLNNFDALKWVKRNDLNGMLKKSFWDKQPGIIQPRREDTFSSKIYKVWKAARNSRAPGAMNHWKSGTYSRPVYSHLRGGPGIQKKTSYRGKNFRSKGPFIGGSITSF